MNSQLRNNGKICTPPSNKLNAIKRLQNHLIIKTKQQLAKTLCVCHFNYCSLVWHFCRIGDMHKKGKDARTGGDAFYFQQVIHSKSTVSKKKTNNGSGSS